MAEILNEVKEQFLRIGERILISTTLTLISPANFGSGESDDLTDIPLALDPLEDRPVIWGTSLAGALRAYLRERLHGYGYGKKETSSRRENNPSAINEESLFGFQRGENGEESWLIINESLAEWYDFEPRSMVKIDERTRTAEKGALIDADLIAAGSRFPLKLELRLPDDPNLSKKIKEYAAIALQGLERGEIRLGAKKTRGWGQIRVDEFQVTIFKMSEPAHLLAWLKQDLHPVENKTGEIEKCLEVEVSLVDERDRCSIQVDFCIKTPLAIGAVLDDPALPDSEPLNRKWMTGKNKHESHYCVSGTSLAGVMRHQAARILHTITDGQEDKVKPAIDSLWGTVNNATKETHISRMIVGESDIQESVMKIQSRIKNDSFTGGTISGALFEQGIIRPSPKSKFRIMYEIKNPKPEEVGLILMVLKDLCSGDISVGGGSGIGRGFLRGERIEIQHSHKKIQATIKQDDLGRLTLEGCSAQSLENEYIEPLKRYCHG